MNTRNLTDFKQGTVVLYKYPNGYLVPGVVVGFYCENIRIQWNDAETGDIMDYHYTDTCIMLESSVLNETNNTVKESSSSIEDKLKELIIHLVGVNQTELACDVIEVLKKYKHNTQSLEFIERNT